MALVYAEDEHFGSSETGPSLQARPGLLHEYFERNVSARPDHPAIECGDDPLSYRELDDYANQIAHYLHAKGLGNGQVVGIYLRKSIHLYAALLAVLKAGAAYVPIDPKFPADRVKHILEDAQAAFVLTDQEMNKLANGVSGSRAVLLDEEAEEIRSHPKSKLIVKDLSTKPGDLCYIIYTSGTTGRPKGVMIEHHSAVNFVAALETVYLLNRDDRVYQGFSIAFDAAVEELWAALSLGGTLVIPPDDVSRSPNEVADFLTSRKVTFFSTVPTFLAMIEKKLPTVRLLVVGGEACPPDIVERWAGDQRMLNTYGPTEATVVATWSECVPGEPVTIGTALPGYTTYILDEDLKRVASGVTGELYIGGNVLARGYANRDELTAEKFIANPFMGDLDPSTRLYSTSDLVRLNKDGDIEFLGRADGQIKIRGFRVELSEIENVLLEHPHIRAAAARVVDCQGQMEIASYVVLEESADRLERTNVAEWLNSRLPDYMVPKFLDEILELTTMTSGKVDRNALPEPENILLSGERKIIAPTTDLEKIICGVWEKVIGETPISIEDDFFADLGGHSLVAARAISHLREKTGCEELSVRDLYANTTVKKLARVIAARLPGQGHKAANSNKPRPTRPTAKEMFATVSPWQRRLCVGLQFVSLWLYYAIISSPIALGVVLTLSVIKGQMVLEQAINISVVISFLYWPIMLALGIVLKWLVIGRYKAGKYPLWGLYYFRWWFVERFKWLGWPTILAGTPMMNVYCRLMGAKIGRNTMIATPYCATYDLLSIGHNTSIGSESQLLGYRIEDGVLHLGAMQVGNDCFIGMHSNLGLGTKMGNRSKLDDLSMLPDGHVIKAREQFCGSPAIPAKVATPELPASGKRRRPIVFGLLHLALIYLMSYVIFAIYAPSIALIFSGFAYGGISWGIAAAFVAIPLRIFWTCGLIVAVKWLFIGRIRPGIIPVQSLAYLKHWFLDFLLDNMREMLLPLYATVYFPKFLRLLGAKIGKNVEISTVLHITPDLLTIEDGSFCADASLVGGKRIHNGAVEILATHIGKNSFIGNSSLVPGGVKIGDNSLIGVLSMPPVGTKDVASGTRWLGSPSFQLPEVSSESCMNDERTYRPTLRLRTLRAVIDALRIVLPDVLLTALAILLCAGIALTYSYELLPLWQIFALTPALAIPLAFLAIGSSAMVKKLLVGTFKPVVEPLYSSFIWLNEVVNGVYETVATPALEPFMGTPFISIGLRMMGCKVGKWAYVETTYFSEFELVEIGDHAALNFGTTIQTHLFEDRVFKSERLKIGDSATLANMSVMLYDTEMQEGSYIGPLSLLMKGDMVAQNARLHGIPVQPIRTGFAQGQPRIRRVKRVSDRRNIDPWRKIDSDNQARVSARRSAKSSKRRTNRT